ncbi:MAG: DUF4956 domain-containing protein [Candidatus Sumerlaeia bacterium]
MMNEMIERVIVGDIAGVGRFDLYYALISLGLAFVLGQASAWMYIYTHQGLSYSRAFVQSIVLLTIIVTLAMMVIGSNIVIAFGLIGALSVIRFRNILKDTRDTAFVFFALIVGMAAGTRNYGLAVMGTIVFSMLLLYLHWTGFGSRNTGDGFLRFHLDAGSIPMQNIQSLLRRYCKSTQLMSQRFMESGAGEIAYRLNMRDPMKGDRMVEELRTLEGVSNITFVLHEEQAEV